MDLHPIFSISFNKFKECVLLFIAFNKSKEYFLLFINRPALGIIISESILASSGSSAQIQCKFSFQTNYFFLISCDNHIIYIYWKSSQSVTILFNKQNMITITLILL